jgi:hypothetical protein
MVLTCDPILYAAVTEAGCILSGSYDLENVTHLPGKANKKNKTSRFVVLTCDPSISVALLPRHFKYFQGRPNSCDCGIFVGTYWVPKNGGRMGVG